MGIDIYLPHKYHTHVILANSHLTSLANTSTFHSVQCTAHASRNRTNPCRQNVEASGRLCELKRPAQHEVLKKLVLVPSDESILQIPFHVNTSLSLL